jgi:hypothetical protein
LHVRLISAVLMRALMPACSTDQSGMVDRDAMIRADLSSCSNQPEFPQ